MSKEMVISANPHETRVAILEEGQLCEYYVEREKEFALVGSIYKGKVTRVLPGMQSAFVEIGLDSDAFLYVSDFLEEIEGFDHVTADDKSAKPGPPSLAAPVGAPAEDAGESSITPLEGESLSGGSATDSLESQPPSTYVPSPIVARPSSNQPHHDRPRFENRGGGGDRNRGFNRRGGRNRHGGRGRGPGGGSGGSGSAGRSGDRRFGRDLPSSKYASPRSFDEPPADPNMPAGHISMVLPGESISKFRSRGDAPAEAPSSELPYESAPDSFNAAPVAEAHDSEAQPRDLQNDAQPGDSQPRDYRPREPRRFDRHPRENRGFDRHSGGASRFRPSEPTSAPSSGSVIEPLPGESISKWKAHAHLPPDPVDEKPSASASHVDEAEGHIQEGHDELGLAASRALDEIASEHPRESSEHLESQRPKRKSIPTPTRSLLLMPSKITPPNSSRKKKPPRSPSTSPKPRKSNPRSNRTGTNTTLTSTMPIMNRDFPKTSTTAPMRTHTKQRPSCSLSPKLTLIPKVHPTLTKSTNRSKLAPKL
jgi:ribonuclease G